MKLGVAVIGLGVGQEHVRAYLETGRCRILWLCDHDAAKARSLAAELGDGAREGGLAKILDDDRVCIVSIASFDQDHAEQALAALRAGKHVFVEKPLGRTEDEIRRIHQVWNLSGGRLKLASNLVLRAAPLYRWLKGAIVAGELGRIYAFDGDYLYGRLARITGGWRKDVLGYSVMLGGGIHLADLMRWLTGERPQEVWAAGNRICSEGTPFLYDDFVTATLRFPSGLLGRLTANFGCVHRHQHVVRVFGTAGTFVYDDAGARIHRTRDSSGSAALELAPLPSSKGALIPDFVLAVEKDWDLTRDVQETFDALSICIACDRALHTGAVEEVQWV